MTIFLFTIKIASEKADKIYSKRTRELRISVVNVSLNLSARTFLEVVYFGYAGFDHMKLCQILV